MSAPVFTLMFMVWLTNILSIYLEYKCIHLLLELIVPLLLDGCSASSSSEKASFVWYSSWSQTS